MKIFLDCDVLLDVGLRRELFRQYSEPILDHLQLHPGKGFMAWHTVANLYYIMAKTAKPEAAKSFVLRLCDFMTIAPCSNSQVELAASMEMQDFEDALQCAAALAVNADFIITRNLEDYQTAPIPVYSPAAAMAHLEEPVE